MKKVLLSFFLCYSFSLVAQVTNNGTPASWKMVEDNSIIKPIVLSDLDIKKIKAEDQVNDKLQAKPWRYGIQRVVDYDFENGEWTVLPNGDRIWRILFNSPDAISLSLNFNQFYLPEGSNLYLYNDDKTDLLGAYTATQNNEKEVLGTWFVMGERVWVEYYEPQKVKDQGKLNISSIIHGYRLGNNYQKNYHDSYEKALNDSGDCNHDVNCPIGADFEAKKDILKKAVAFLNLGNGFICTGTLINNTAEDRKPYFLTANHCFTDTEGNLSNPDLYSMRFSWISPNPVCGTISASTDANENLTISGSTLRARNEASDVMLVEFNNPIPSNWDVTYAGWDRTDNFPNFSVGIHHPSGDIMKISRDNDPPEKVAQNAGGTSQIVQTWDLTTAEGGWEIGVTEGGSSGSALFNQDGKIIGQLYGGSAVCIGTNDNNQHDFYGRFAVSWDTGLSPSNRLKDWLDPLNINSEMLDSFPLAEVFAIDGSVFSIIPSVACGTFDVSPTIVVRNAGSTTLTSLNINWDIDGGTSTIINWTGSLAQNETENIVLSPITVTSGAHIFNVSSANPNGGTDENSTNDDNAINFSLTNEFTTNQVHLELLTDDFSEETTWEFRDGNGTVLNSGGPYDGATNNNSTFQETFNISTEACYTFEIFDSEGDGICCGFGNGSYSLKADSDTVIIQSNGAFGFSEITEMNIKLKNSEFIKENIVLFPNPTSSGILQIKGYVDGLKFDVYNTLGQTLKSNEVLNNAIIDLKYLPNGFYFIRIIEISSNKSVVKKILLGK